MNTYKEKINVQLDAQQATSALRATGMAEEDIEEIVKTIFNVDCLAIKQYKFDVIDADRLAAIASEYRRLGGIEYVPRYLKDAEIGKARWRARWRFRNYAFAEKFTTQSFDDGQVIFLCNAFNELIKEEKNVRALIWLQKSSIPLPLMKKLYNVWCSFPYSGISSITSAVYREYQGAPVEPVLESICEVFERVPVKYRNYKFYLMYDEGCVHIPEYVTTLIECMTYGGNSDLLAKYKSMPEYLIEIGKWLAEGYLDIEYILDTYSVIDPLVYDESKSVSDLIQCTPPGISVKALSIIRAFRTYCLDKDLDYPQDIIIYHADIRLLNAIIRAYTERKILSIPRDLTYEQLKAVLAGEDPRKAQKETNHFVSFRDPRFYDFMFRWSPEFDAINEEYSRQIKVAISKLKTLQRYKPYTGIVSLNVFLKRTYEFVEPEFFSDLESIIRISSDEFPLPLCIVVKLANKESIYPDIFVYTDCV